MIDQKQNGDFMTNHGNPMHFTNEDWVSNKLRGFAKILKDLIIWVYVHVYTGMYVHVQTKVKLGCCSLGTALYSF